MTKTFVLIILSSVFALCVNAQDSFIQPSVGAGILQDIKFGGFVGLEFKPANFNKLTYSLNYNSYDVNGFSTIQGSTTYHIAYSKYFSLLANWYPISIKNQVCSLLQLSGGPTVIEFGYNDNQASGGIGLRGVVGLQYSFFNKLTLGANLDIIFYYETFDKDRDYKIIMEGLYSNIYLGYRFFRR